MTERFTQTLRRQSEPTWSAAVGHRFVKELCDGSVADPVMVRYLVQDHRFLDSFLTLLGAAIATADTFEARLRLGRFAGMISSDENTYFLRAFQALDVSPAQRDEPADTLPTAGFKAIMREAAATVRMPPPWRYSMSPRACTWIGRSRHRNRCRPTLSTPSGSPCMTTRSSATSSPSCKQNWIGSGHSRRH